jgi:hypothetical protein
MSNDEFARVSPLIELEELTDDMPLHVREQVIASNTRIISQMLADFGPKDNI